MSLRGRKLAKLAAFASLLASPLLLLLPTGRSLTQELESVLVANFPALQRVEGEVEIGGTVRHASFERRGEILVPPADRSQPTQLVPAGGLVTDGFTWVTLGLSGETKGVVTQPGEVGVLLVPDDEAVLAALDEGLYQLSLETAAPVAAGAALVASAQVRLAVGFPRYRVFLYNTSNRTVGVHLFAYLSY